MSVFTVSPARGSIAAGQCQDVTVTFQPDHPAVNYSDRLTVELSNKVSETQRTLSDRFQAQCPMFFFIFYYFCDSHRAKCA